jgi:hypothetical protein
MKKIMTICCMLFLAMSKIGYAQATLTGNNGTGNITSSICDLGSIFLSASTINFDPQNPNAHTYKWQWYKNNTFIYQEPTNFSPSVGLPNQYIGAGTYNVKLTIDSYYILWTNSITITTTGIAGSYSAAAITNRMVSGDFDRDGKEDDIAAFYDYGNLNTTIHVWKSNGSSFTYQGDNGWWHSSQYNAAKLVAVVSGDFNRDGFKDDIAGFYDYGNFHTELHVWISSGSGFSFSSRWIGTSYDATKIAKRVVSGDFDRDGFKDDIAAFYDYGTFSTNIHVWQSTGTSFVGPATAGWYSNNSYSSSKITGRVVSGDFDRDGFEDDIAAFYDYGTFSTTIHVWQSTGSSFAGPTTAGWYSNNSYSSSKITGRVVSGDFDRDGFKDDIAAFYDYGSFTTRIHVWQSTGSSFAGPSTAGWWWSPSYDANKITYRVVSGDFNTDGSKDNISAMYDYGNFSAALHVWNSTSTTFSYVGDGGFWKVCNPSRSIEASVDDLSQVDGINVFPNPTNGLVNIKVGMKNANVDIFNLVGEKVYSTFIKDEETATVDLSDYPKGVYIVNITDGVQSQRTKLILQ